MKRFVFRLERVLGIRRFELDRARIALAAAEAEAARLARVYEEATREVERGRRLLDDAASEGGDGALFGLLARSLRTARTKVLFARQAVDSYERERARARERVRACRARVESLERLRERREASYRKAAEAAAQNEIEELAMARFARAQAALGLVLTLLCVGLAAAVPAGAQSPASAAADGAEKNEAANESALPESVTDLLSGPGFSKGVDVILSEVRTREIELTRRELEVAEREIAAKELEGMVAQRAGELEKIRAEVETRILAWSTQGGDRIEQLSGVYAVMPAAEAAELLAKLDLDLAVSIIRQMKKKVSASVLAAMRPDRALLVSRRILQPLDPATDAPPARLQ